MRRRYNLRRSDNFMVTGRVSYVTLTSSGTIKIYTGFAVTRATVGFATIPWPDVPGTDSSSSSSSSELPIFLYDALDLPRIYVSSYESDGFVVSYEGIPESIGYIEFNYSAV
jgi:hypothetical protein